MNIEKKYELAVKIVDRHEKELRIAALKRLRAYIEVVDAIHRIDRTTVDDETYGAALKDLMDKAMEERSSISDTRHLLGSDASLRMIDSMANGCDVDPKTTRQAIIDIEAALRVMDKVELAPPPKPEEQIDWLKYPWATEIFHSATQAEYMVLLIEGLGDMIKMELSYLNFIERYEAKMKGDVDIDQLAPIFRKMRRDLETEAEIPFVLVTSKTKVISIQKKV